jgi:hypothetical protein
MADISTLLDRIDTELSTVKDRVKKAQSEQLQKHQAREKRLLEFEKRLEELPGVWKPRL